MVVTPQLTKGEQTQQEILAAARVLFLAQGYTATTMRQIARSVGITPGAIYNHFPGKEEIFGALLQEVAPYERLFAFLREIEADSVEELVRGAFRGVMETLVEHQDYVRLALIDTQERDGAALTALMPQFFPQIQAFYQRVLALDAGRGRLREIPLPVLMRAQISLVAGFLVTEEVVRSTQLFQAPDTDWAEALAEVSLYGVLKPDETERR
jgi:AcrR family transcriptional regulator